MVVKPKVVENEKKKVNFKRALVVAGAILFTAGFGVRYLSFNSGIASFRQQCRSIHKNERLEDIQSRALIYGLHVEVDEQPQAFADEGYYLLKPWRDWPRQFSCRFHVKFGRVVFDE